MIYANFWQRFIGWLVDFIIIFPISWIIYKSSIGPIAIYSQPIFMLFEGVYYVIFWLYKGATPGMMLMKIKLISKKQLTIQKAVLRYIGTYISVSCLCIGALWMVWDKNSQTWQDKMGKTFVVKMDSETIKK